MHFTRLCFKLSIYFVSIASVLTILIILGHKPIIHFLLKAILLLKILGAEMTMPCVLLIKAMFWMKKHGIKVSIFQMNLKKILNSQSPMIQFV
ncbi:hypothetical protein B6S12_08745 [Helicobacter valdiviensis]|uniref:Uncharacterized protein n=1 Tax=Helicobacter valdiviensis TaxID=1458358 RepID=A0A2W6PLI2_9HELI|nr:hypothetical protein B6S12_08745 [Helicobacter valdiviensis]